MLPLIRSPFISLLHGASESNSRKRGFGFPRQKRIGCVRGERERERERKREWERERERERWRKILNTLLSFLLLILLGECFNQLIFTAHHWCYTLNKRRFVRRERCSYLTLFCLFQENPCSCSCKLNNNCSCHEWNFFLVLSVSLKSSFWARSPLPCETNR